MRMFNVGKMMTGRPQLREARQDGFSGVDA